MTCLVWTRERNIYKEAFTTVSLQRRLMQGLCECSLLCDYFWISPLVQTRPTLGSGEFIGAEGTKHSRYGCHWDWTVFRDFVTTLTTWVLDRAALGLRWPQIVPVSRDVRLLRVAGCHASPLEDLLQETRAVHFLLWGTVYSTPTILCGLFTTFSQEPGSSKEENNTYTENLCQFINQSHRLYLTHTKVFLIVDAHRQQSLVSDTEGAEALILARENIVAGARHGSNPRLCLLRTNQQGGDRRIVGDPQDTNWRIH